MSIINKFYRMNDKEKTIVFFSVILILGALFFLVGYQFGVNMVKEHYAEAAKTKCMQLIGF